MTSTELNQPADPFSFTERERLWYRISDARLQLLLADERTTVHQVELSANTYGEFLFLSLSLPEHSRRPVGERGSVVTFWGLGFHEYRERWITEQWNWYEAFSHPELLERTVDKIMTQQLLEERRNHIRPYLDHQTQTERGKLFELLADLTDEDGAWAELDDLSSWLYEGSAE